MKIFATYNLKGGVGKTATAVNLAYLSARDGYRTLLWDLDPQGAATFYFRVEPKVKGGGRKLLTGKRELEDVVRGSDYPHLDVLPADFSYRHMDRDLDKMEGGKKSKKPAQRLAALLQPLSEAYDHVFLDCAPSISRVSEAVFVAADALLVPTIPTVLSLRTLAQLREHLGKRGPKRLQVLPFFALVDRRKGLHRRIVAQAGDHGALHTNIPYSTWVERMGLERRPLPVYAPYSEASRAYEELWREVLGEV